MKKTIALAALVCAAMGMNAEVFEYDFNTSPAFFPLLQAPVEEGGMAQAGNYDFIDKTGTPKVNGSKGELLQAKDDEGNWVATKPLCRISLDDGYAYYLDEATGKYTDGEYDLDETKAFIGYGPKGPSRITWMYGWGTTDQWVDKDYNAADADNWVATKHGMGFLRNSNSGVRQDSYIQFPAVQGAATVTVWAGHAGSKYTTELRVKITPVVDGVEQPAFSYYLPLDQAVAKRYYKLTLSNLDTTTLDSEGNRKYADPYSGNGSVAYRIGDAASELHLYHVRIETGSSAIEDVIADTADENAPVYNILGQRVDESYKGLVIKNGVKYIQK